MAFDYNSRTKWEKERIEGWEKAHQVDIRRLTPEKKEIFDEIFKFSDYPHCGFPVIRKWIRKNISGSAPEKGQTPALCGKSLKEIILSEFGDIVKILVPAEYRGDYEYMLDQLTDFQYSRAIFRPTVRTADPAAHVLDAFGLMQAYKVLGILGVSQLGYLVGGSPANSNIIGEGPWGQNVDPETADFIRNDTYARKLHMIQFDDILAAGIDRGDENLVSAVKDAILSDNNTVLVSVPMIRGIVKSRNTELHELLAKFLVAARLQEGVRQAICENADCGRAEAFITILSAIEDNDLLRFSAVKRAIATWTGICNLDSMERVSAKLLAGIGEAVRDRGRAVKAAQGGEISGAQGGEAGGSAQGGDKALEMTYTDDSVQIVTGLWAMGFYEARDAVARMLQIVESGTKNQRLTISYYNRYMQHSDFSGQAAKRILETYPEDQQMAAAFMPTYLNAVETIVSSCIRDKNNKPVYSVNEEDLTYIPLDVREIFEDREEARRHYDILKNLAGSMKKRKVEYSPMVFPWYGAVLDKSDLTQRMALIAYALQDQDLIDETCVRLTDIMDSYYNTRKNYLRILLHDPRTKIQRDALIGYVADKESYTRTAAWQILKKLQSDPDVSKRLTQDEYRQLEGYLRLKNEEARRYIIEILEGQDKEGIYASISRLLGGEEQSAASGEGAGGTAESGAGKTEKAAKGKKKTVSAADREQMRLAGLDMLKRRSEKNESAKKECAALLCGIIPDPSVLSDKEKVLYEEIAGSEGAGSILNKEGYGLYDPRATYEPELKAAGTAGAHSGGKGLAGLSGVKAPAGLRKGLQLLQNTFGLSDTKKLLKDYFSLSAKELDQYFDKIKAFIVEHGKLEYTSVNGEKQLLENGLYLINYDYSGAIETRYPFPELWIEVYEKIIKDPKVLFNLHFAARGGYDETDVKDMAAYLKAEKTIFGEAYSGYHYADPKYMGGRQTHSTYQTILDIIESQQHLVLPAYIAQAAVLAATELPEEIRWMERAPSKYSNFYLQQRPTICFVRSNKFRGLLTLASQYESDDEFRSVFPLLYRTDRVYQFDAHEPNTRYGGSSSNILSIHSYVKAHELGMITRDFLYKAAFEMVGLKYAVGDLGDIFRPNVTVYALRTLRFYMPVDLEKRTMDTENRFYKLSREVYQNLVNLILDVELKRGDTPTVFSDAVSRISRIEGIPRLMEILRALGKDTLDRNTYYSFNSGTSRKECLSHLLKVSWPGDGETADDLKKAVKENKVSVDRLIEVAMYAPQWLELAEEVLGIDGFTSGCYYFMAHMNERFDDRKKAVIARYTPLTPEELNNGCFDTNWFFEVYEKLGEKNFSKLYKAAKYIADGSKHTRARKYADAATGKVDRDELEKVINDKRNKDLLMSYGLIPMKDRQDALHRYEYLQKFLKESKQFGAQRRQSEAQCVQYAMKNMATTAGYADELRLTLAMETELVTSNQVYFDGITIGDYVAQIFVDADGKSELKLFKKGKAVKSVPAALKKDETFADVKEFASKLKGQYSRCAAMFERAMEEEDAYSYGELLQLCRNPVTAGILGRLVFVAEDCAAGADAAAGAGDVGSAGQAGAAGAASKPVPVGTLEMLKSFEADSGTGAGDAGLPEAGTITSETRLLVAHPVTLYRLGVLPDFQRMFFEKQKETGLKQPFKQVFREFYVKLAEEKDALDSRMFAGYQIQPKKTVAALRGRRWVADYGEGRQKIFFKQNIAATIYALADWFSPADTESPTLEYVSFYDRKTYKQKKLSEVPDILYSEVMRDVDLAVSVAHVGGVDPETSHSTIEMRRVIFEFNMELFGLTNVTFEGTHAFIRGTLGNYNIQLGSGVIHKESGGMINILPVHSQHRGKLFLPFIDEDPKTAEILSKILLLAEDRKIKDPYILEQLK